ncbi:MAG: glycine cleavage system aminomethyltransferase GcvT [Deltaproteobacteria bacterium]|nr:glycine cleavage system aminomethyltransferase GcvT [Deltaproteobacteria bacterium]
MSETRDYVYVPPEESVRKTLLHAWHAEAGAKMVPFGGWEMPVQYPTGIFAEHAATRTAASLFDVSHMSCFEFTGPDAGAFLEGLLAGLVEKVAVGQAAYTALFYPHGRTIDDAFIYRLGDARYMLVVNAGNAREVWAWASAVLAGDAVIDPHQRDRRLPNNLTMRDLRDEGSKGLLDLALQGPKSHGLLMDLADDDASIQTVANLERNRIEQASIAGHAVYIARTGYTGESVGFEIFVAPPDIVDLWTSILDAGRSLGVLPAGLGARDAARLEAGLPLFGHELEGEFGGTIHEAGYPWMPKIAHDTPWFIGKAAYHSRVSPKPGRHLLRLAGRGAKTVREGHRILNGEGEAVGVVTSFAFLDDAKNFVVLAYTDSAFDPAPGDIVRAARIKDDPEPGADLSGKIVELTVRTRFPKKVERDGWRKLYSKSDG